MKGFTSASGHLCARTSRLGWRRFVPELRTNPHGPRQARETQAGQPESVFPRPPPTSIRCTAFLGNSGIPNDTVHTKYTVVLVADRVFAIYRIMLRWKTYKYFYETDELPNSRPTQPKKRAKMAFGPLFVAFGPLFPTANIFSCVGINLYRKQMKKLNSPQTSYLWYHVLSSVNGW